MKVLTSAIRAGSGAVVATVVATLAVCPAAASESPPDLSAGIYKLGGNSVGVPYRTSSGIAGLLTANHGGIGDQPGVKWPITDAHGNSATASLIPGANSASLDVAVVRPDWSSPATPEVALSDDYRARFQSAAAETDIHVGDRVCRTGWSPLSSGADGHMSANVIPAPDIPSAGHLVICGRVSSVSATSILVSSSDRPDGLIIGRGDSGGAVWMPTEDGAFMFVGVMTAAVGSFDGPTVGGAVTATRMLVRPAWAIASTLGITPLTDPASAHPYLTITPSTYFPTAGGRVTLTGLFRDRSGAPLSSKTIHVLSDGGRVVGTAETNALGRLTYAVTGAKPSTDFAFRFAGDAETAPVASRYIRIAPTIVTIQNPPTQSPGGNVTIVARATAGGTPIPGRSVRLQIYPVNGDTYTVSATSTTDAQGYATLTTPAPTQSIRYAVRLMEDPTTNGNPVGAAASAIFPLQP